MRRAIWAIGVLGLYLLSPVLARAQEQTGKAGTLFVQLNNAQTMEGGCQLTFALKNDTGTDIKKSSYNMAVINAQQQVSTLITFEFRPLVSGQTKFQQFGLPGEACEQISGLLINDFVECTTADGASPICESSIEQSTLTAIAFPWELVVN